MQLPQWLARFNRHVTNPIQRMWAGWAPTMGILEHVGRRSGKPYRTPLTVFTTDDGVAILLTYGPDRDWLKNITAAGRARCAAWADVRADRPAGDVQGRSGGAVTGLCGRCSRGCRSSLLCCSRAAEFTRRAWTWARIGPLATVVNGTSTGKSASSERIRRPGRWWPAPAWSPASRSVRRCTTARPPANGRNCQRSRPVDASGLNLSGIEDQRALPECRVAVQRVDAHRNQAARLDPVAVHRDVAHRHSADPAAGGHSRIASRSTCTVYPSRGTSAGSAPDRRSRRPPRRRGPARRG